MAITVKDGFFAGAVAKNGRDQNREVRGAGRNAVFIAVSVKDMLFSFVFILTTS